MPVNHPLKRLVIYLNPEIPVDAEILAHYKKTRPYHRSRVMKGLIYEGLKTMEKGRHTASPPSIKRGSEERDKIKGLLSGEL